MLEDIRIAQMFPGWTLEYIRNLNWADREGVLAVVEAQIRHRAVGK